MRVFTTMCVVCLTVLVGIGCAEESGGDGQGASGGPSAELEELERKFEEEEKLEREFEDEEPEGEFEEEPGPEEFEEEESQPEEEAIECDPNYSGACLDPYASDYDCAGGSGDGPEYTGPVTVVGEDHYGLDSDGDGSACE